MNTQTLTPLDAFLSILNLADRGGIEPQFLSKSGVFFEDGTGKWSKNMEAFVLALNAIGIPCTEDRENTAVLLGDAIYISPED
jgi:hypothetical protein